MQGNNIHGGDVFAGSIITGVLMAVSASLNVLNYVGDLGPLLHLMASCATIVAACTTTYVGVLTAKKLLKEK
jgi:hypothetical protein